MELNASSDIGTDSFFCNICCISLSGYQRQSRCH